MNGHPVLSYTVSSACPTHQVGPMRWNYRQVAFAHSEQLIAPFIPHLKGPSMRIAFDQKNDALALLSAEKAVNHRLVTDELRQQPEILMNLHCTTQRETV